MFGVMAIRRQGLFVAMIPLALAQLVFFVFVQAPFPGGVNGLQGVPRGHLFGLVDMQNNMAMYYFVLAVFVLGFTIIQRTIHSPYGQVLKAIRKNEPRAVSLGYNVDRQKLLARSEEHTSELQSLIRISSAGFSLKKKKNKQQNIQSE